MDAGPADPQSDRLAGALDAASPVSLSVQLRGALEYGIAVGDLEAGARLPSVRALARRLGMSPVTVSGVYAVLREAGHIEGRAGSGTFVRRDAPGPAAARLTELDARIAELVRLGRSCGLSPADLAGQVARAGSSRRRALRLAMLGTFPEATEGYACDLRAHLPEGDTIEALTLAALEADPCAGPGAPDLVVAPRTIVAQARRLFPDVPAVGVTLIPNEATRVALAALAPETRLVGYSFLPAFVTTMRAGLARFAPHVEAVTMVVRGQADEAERIAEADAVVLASGAEALRHRLAPGQAAFEYRHRPDARSVRDELLPALEARRAALAGASDGLARGAAP